MNMPRGRKKVTPESLEQQINSLDADIEGYQQKIREAKEKRKELVELKKKQDLEALYTTIQSSGRSVEEVLRLLKDQPDQEKAHP
jgi:peptidoglycan hydrolase CwlO-like protein